MEEIQYKKLLEKYENQSKVICPKCQTNEFSIPVIYGKPGKEMIRLAEEGKVKLMGCCLSTIMPVLQKMPNSDFIEKHIHIYYLYTLIY